jgi:hypothetical protein
MDADYILNGRVNLFETPTKTAKIYNNDVRLYDQKNLESISRNYTGTCVSEVFFSRENVDIIHEGLINYVYNKTNGKYKISRQSEQELSIVMRSIYLSSGKNLNFNIKEQIKALNKEVIEWCSEQIITNIKQYLDYKTSVSTLKMPMETPALTSQKGLKTTEFSYF